MRYADQPGAAGSRRDEGGSWYERLPEIGIDLPESWQSDVLSYEPYAECASGRAIGVVHWLETVDVRIRAGIWRLDLDVVDRPVRFTGDETFQVLDGYAEVVANGLLMMTLAPADTGSIPSGLLTEWWIVPPFAKLFVIGAEAAPPPQ